MFTDNPETSRLIALDVLKALGKMPFGGNYLLPIAPTMISDPVFTDVRDRSNANFLWFIKFERSFAAAEKEVPAPQEKAKKPKAEIIAFPAKTEISDKKSDSKESSGKADIVLLTSK